MPPSEPHRQLSAATPEFQPAGQVTQTVQSHQPHEPDLVAVQDLVPPALANLPSTEDLQEEPAVDTGEEAGSEEHVDHHEHITEPPREEEPSVRRSTRAVKPREMLTYDHLGQPSYQPWRPGVNLMFTCVPFPMPFYSAVPEPCYYPTPVWTC